MTAWLTLPLALLAVAVVMLSIQCAALRRDVDRLREIVRELNPGADL